MLLHDGSFGFLLEEHRLFIRVRQRSKEQTHLNNSWWQVLELLVKSFFHPFSHLSNYMVGTVEGDGVGDHEPDVRNELLCTVIPRIVEIGVGLGGIRGVQLALDGRKVHGMLDNRWIVWDVEGDRVDGKQEWHGVLGLLQAFDCGRKEAQLLKSQT